MLEMANLGGGVRLGDVVVLTVSLSYCELHEAKLISQLLAADHT